MTDEKHADTERRIEEKHLAETLAEISVNHAALASEKKEIDAKVEELIRQYDPDNVELYNELVVGLSLQSALDRRVGSFERAASRPYFARIDVDFDDEDDADGPERIYIGKNGLSGADSEPLVTDWRAPVASLYYDAAPGRASYTAPGGEFGAELMLKRTFEIEDGRLLDFYDTDVVANDELLIKYLGRNRDAALSDIVATIQREQNAIIREDPWKSIVVQGAAGSGKTTVAMHRLAWITYNYRDRFRESEFYIIGGSNMFLHYITAMLPELDVRDARQMTFSDFLMKLLTDDDDRGFESFDPRPARGDVAQKSSVAFASALSEWLEELRASVFEPNELTLWGVTLLTKDEARSIAENRRGLSFSELADVLAERIEFTGGNSRKRMEEFIEQQYDADARDIIDDVPDRSFGELTQAVAAKNKRLAGIRSELTRQKRFYRKRLPSKPVPTLYRQFLGWLASRDAAWEQTAKTSAANVAKNAPDVIDLCMMLMIKHALQPLPSAENVQHLIIDEAQDYAESCYIALKSVLGKCVFTIMGDLAQNISASGGLASWDALLDGPFNDGRTAFFNLKKSYRNTIEISRFAGRVLAHLPAGRYGVEPVIRHGEPPLVKRCLSEEELAASAAALIKQYLADGLHTVAIVTRTRAEAEIAHSLLPGELGAQLACDADGEYSGGVTVFPAGMVKGMEFDAVIVWNADADRYTEADGKLFYVVLTRAMHRLSLLHTGSLTHLLDE